MKRQRAVEAEMSKATKIGQARSKTTGRKTAFGADSSQPQKAQSRSESLGLSGAKQKTLERQDSNYVDAGGGGEDAEGYDGEEADLNLGSVGMQQQQQEQAMFGKFAKKVNDRSRRNESQDRNVDQE